MPTIAVTGATGFVGSHLVQALIRSGYSVISYGRSAHAETYWDISKGSLEHPPQVDAVVHCAAHVSDWANYAESYSGNVLGTQNVLKSFPDVSMFIHISSASVYDPFLKSSVLTEDAPCGNFLNAYSKTKWESEILVLGADNPRRVILRPHIIYGPGDTTVLPRILEARKFGRFLIIGNGKNLISITHVENLVHAILKTLSANFPIGSHIFNVADKDQATVEVLMQELCHTLSIVEPIAHVPRGPAYVVGAIEELAYRLIRSPKPPLLTRYAVAQMAYGHALDISKIERVLNYTPLWDYRKGFIGMKV